jgi:hypothetical protein
LTVVALIPRLGLLLGNQSRSYGGFFDADVVISIIQRPDLSRGRHGTVLIGLKVNEGKKAPADAGAGRRGAEKVDDC